MKVMKTYLQIGSLNILSKNRYIRHGIVLAAEINRQKLEQHMGLAGRIIMHIMQRLKAQVELIGM